MASSKAIANSVLVLRIFTLLFLAASVVLMATNHFELSDGSKKASFKDVIAYRYVIATALVGFAYTTIQIPFAIYHACTEKRLIRNGCVPEFDFYGDKIISFLLATGVGAGFAVTLDVKRIFNQLFGNATGIDEQKSKIIAFLNRGYISSGMLLGGFICLALLSILSSISRNKTKGFFG